MFEQPTLKEFIDNKRLGYPSNAYVEFDGFNALYVRHGFHYIDGELINTLDLANITASKPGSGAFTKLIDWIFKNYPDTIVFVENVTNPRFDGKLERMGFTRLKGEPPYCYLLLKEKKGIE